VRGGGFRFSASLNENQSPPLVFLYCRKAVSRKFARFDPWPWFITVPILIPIVLFFCLLSHQPPNYYRQLFAPLLNSPLLSYPRRCHLADPGVNTTLLKFSVPPLSSSVVVPGDLNILSKLVRDPPSFGFKLRVLGRGIVFRPEFVETMAFSGCSFFLLFFFPGEDFGAPKFLLTFSSSSSPVPIREIPPPFFCADLFARSVDLSSRTSLLLQMCNP